MLLLIDVIVLLLLYGSVDAWHNADPGAIGCDHLRFDRFIKFITQKQGRAEFRCNSRNGNGNVEKKNIMTMSLKIDRRKEKIGAVAFQFQLLHIIQTMAINDIDMNFFPTFGRP